MVRSLLCTLLSLSIAFALAGCGGEDTQRAQDDFRDRFEDLTAQLDDLREVADDIRADAERITDEVRQRVEDVLADLNQVVPEAGPQTQRPTTGGDTSSDEMERFLTEVLEDVDEYWTATLTKQGIAEPSVRYAWLREGERANSACDFVADDHAAFYCPADDTIYVGQVIAAEVYDGVVRGFPGQEAGEGRAVGDFGVAYLVAHEYAHNLQEELGFFRSGPNTGAKPFELQADCMAGNWANSKFQRGELKPGDVEEAMNTALAVGDFDFNNEQHHGTPNERRAAWLLGYETGDPSECRRFVAV